MKRLLPLLLLPVLARAAVPGPAAPAAAPGGDAAAPALAPEDLIFTNNVVRNPSFEKGFERDARKGWRDTTYNGMDVDCDSGPKNKPESPPDGKKALRMAVKKTVNYSGGELRGDWDRFWKAGNDGSGPPSGNVVQLVPVRTDRVYALRFTWRSSGLYENRAPGRERGVVEGVVNCTWCDRKGEPIAADTDFPTPRYRSFKKDPKEPGWTTTSDPDLSAQGRLSNPNQVFYAPPPGAEYLRIEFRFACRREKVKPEFWVDSVILSEQPEGTPVAVGPPPKAPAPPKAPEPPKK